MTNNQQQSRDKRFQQVTNIIINNEEFLLVANGNSYDSVAAATGLALVLKSIGKKVTIYSPVEIKADQFESLVGVDQFDFQLEANSKKLLVTLDCPIDQIERVTSDDQGEKLTLVVEFRDKPISSDRVRVKSGGPEFKAGFIFDSQLKEETEITKEGSWVWFSVKGENKPWAEVSFVDQKATLSELTTSMIGRAGFKLTPEAANNLFLGIKRGTENFEKADSIALETAAYCLRIKEETAKPEEKVVSQTSLEAVENKEGYPSEGEPAASNPLQKPPIFTGATTPKV